MDFSLARRAVLLAAFSTPLVAQSKLGPRSFFPVDHDIVMTVDMDEVIESGLWDPIERSVFRPMLQTFYRAFGFDIADLTRVRIAVRFPREQGQSIPARTFVLEGSERVGTARLDPEKLGPGYEKSRVGDFDVVRGANEWRELYVSPRSGILVFGSPGHIESILRGEKRGGVAAPDVEALIAGRGRLGFIAGRLPEAPDGSPVRGNPWPREWETEDDLVDLFFMGVNKDPQTGVLSFDAMFRFSKGAEGPARFAAGAKASIDDVRPKAKILEPYFDKLKIEVDGAVVRASVELGQPEDVFGLLGPVAALMWTATMGGGDAVESVEAVPVQGGEGKGKGK